MNPKSLPFRSLKEAPADVRAVFDALLVFMGDTWSNVNAYSTKDANGALTCGITATDAMGNTFTYSERIVGPRVELSPASVSLGPGETQQFTATVTGSDGNPVAGAVVTWSVATGSGTIDAAGLYTAPAAVPSSTSDSVVGTYQGSSATAIVNLHV